MGLRFDPIGGGQFKQVVQSVIETERQPIKALEVRKSREEARLKLFQEFKNKFTGIDKTLNDFSDFRKFRELKVDLGDGANYVSVSVDKDRAEPGTYSLQVDQLAARTSVMSNGFDDPDEQVLGTGFVVVNLKNGKTKEVFIDQDHASLHGVASQINSDPTSPIRATVLKDGSNTDKPWRLIIAAKAEGTDDHVDFPEFYFMDGIEDFYIDDESESRNALLYLDGFSIQSESNHIKDFVTGVDLQLKAARPDTPLSITITEDHQKVSGKVKVLVDQINGILEFINKQNQIDEKSDTRTTFAGDTSLQTIEYRLRNLFHEGFPVGDPEEDYFRFTLLNEIGIEFAKNGQLTFKEDKFTKALEADFEGTTEAITGPYGFASQLKEVIAGYIRNGDGMLSMREQGFRSRIKRIDDEIAQKERRIDQRTQALTEKFSRLQGSLSNLQRQQQYLGAALPAGGGGNLIAQLLGG